jgi:hypothetical protein
MERGEMMKHLVTIFLIILVITVSCGAVWGQENLREKEIAVAGTIPIQWGSLQYVLPGPKDYQMRLFFEDNKGNIRIVTLSNVEAMGPDVYTVVWGNVPVIRRSK